MYILLVFAYIFLYLFYNFYWKRRNYPPGPTPIPFFGNLIAFYGQPKLWEVFIKWRKEYGDIYTYWFGDQPVVAVNDYETMVETFIKDGSAYEGRIEDEEFKQVFSNGDNGIGFVEGPKWKEQRRFALQVLRNFGMGRNLMQEKILKEFSYLVKYVRKDIQEGLKEIDIVKHIDIAVGSIINLILFGYRFDGATAHEFYHLKHTVDDHLRLLGHPTVMLMKKKFHFFGRLPYFSKFYQEILKNKESLNKFYRRNIEEHKARIDFTHNSEPQDFCEAYLREIEKMRGVDGVHYFTEDQLIGVMNDLWIAGQETTTTTLAFAVLFMMLYPDVQKRVQEELDRVVGSDRFVTMEDKPNLHYVSAVCQEIQRAGSIVTQNLFHKTTKEVVIKGYKFPPGTCIVPQVSVVLNDEKIFPNPEEFIPERFLDENGEFKKVDEMCSFSLGKRVCLGESLARMEIYLFVANMCNHFNFSIAPGKKPTLERKLGATAAPHPYVVHIEERFKKSNGA